MAAVPCQQMQCLRTWWLCLLACRLRCQTIVAETAQAVLQFKLGAQRRNFCIMHFRHVSIHTPTPPSLLFCLLGFLAVCLFWYTRLSVE